MAFLTTALHLLYPFSYSATLIFVQLATALHFFYRFIIYSATFIHSIIQLATTLQSNYPVWGYSLLPILFYRSFIFACVSFRFRFACAPFPFSRAYFILSYTNSKMKKNNKSNGKQQKQTIFIQIKYSNINSLVQPATTLYLNWPRTGRVL